MMQPVDKPNRVFFPTVKNFWVIMGVLILAQVIISGVIRLLPQLPLGLELFLSYTIPLGIVVAVSFTMQSNEQPDGFTSLFKKFDPLIIPPVLLFIVGFGFISDFLQRLFPEPEWFNEMMSSIFTSGILGFITACIAAPLLEELMFRGVLLRSFLKNYSVKKALVWSALFFAIIHLNPWQAVPAFGLGLLMAWLFYRTGSILPSIIVHFLNNTIAFVMASYLGMNFSLYGEMSWGASVALLLVGCVAVLYAVYRLNRIFKLADASATQG